MSIVFVCKDENIIKHHNSLWFLYKSNCNINSTAHIKSECNPHLPTPTAVTGGLLNYKPRRLNSLLWLLFNACLYLQTVVSVFFRRYHQESPTPILRHSATYHACRMLAHSDAGVSPKASPEQPSASYLVTRKKDHVQPRDHFRPSSLGDTRQGWSFT